MIAQRCSFIIILALLGTSAPAFAQTADGVWAGAIAVMGQDLGIMVKFTTSGTSTAATIDIPQQMALGMPLSNVRWAPPAVHFELPAGPGLAIFDGVVKGDSITGTFRQSGIKGTFHVGRLATALVPVPVVTKEPPPPYTEENITIRNGGVTLAGTLSVPPGDKPHPAIVMITGSGAQDRDEEVFGFKVFRTIADHLVRNGIAVLRCDDRGVGGSTGNLGNSTEEDLSGDALAAVSYLKGRRDIDPLGIGLFGHSEGGLIAPLAATRSHDVAFIVLMAGPAVRGDRLILYQIEEMMRGAGTSEDQIAAALASRKEMLDAVRSGKGWDAILMKNKQERAASLGALSAVQRASIDSAEFVDSTAEQEVRSEQSPWFVSFVQYDPVPALEGVTCPVLALFGEKDEQVPVSLNQAPMEEALRRSGTKDWHVAVVPGANHLFQSAGTGSPMEYSSLKKEFAPGFLGTVTTWIGDRTGLGHAAPR